MKVIQWNDEKNILLKNIRNICFEDILLAISEGRLLAIEENIQQNKYPGQKIMIITMNKYIYIVPFIEDEEMIFLKTIYPDRKYYKKYKNFII